MTPEQYAQFEETMRATVQQATADAVRITVNGKIDRLDTKLEAYIKEDNAWKESAQPTIDMGNNARGFGIIFMKIVGVLAAIGAVYLMMRDLTKK